MRICIVTQQLKRTVSGVGLHANNLIDTLCHEGHEVCVVAPRDQRPDGNLPYQFIPVAPPLFAGSQARWISLAWNFRRALRSLTQRQALDIIHFTDARESLFWKGPIPRVGNINDTYSAELHPLRYYLSHYYDGLLRWAYYHFVHACEKIALNRLDIVMANSRFTARTIQQNYHVPEAHLRVCYKSVVTADYAELRAARANASTHPTRVLFVGTNMQRKGLPGLIQAARQVIESFPQVEFWVVGQDPALPRLKEFCQEQGVMPNFHFLGWKSQAELRQVYAECDIFAMPSLTEAFGVVLLEALASGLLVVSTNVGGIPEIIQNERDGLLVPPENPDELAQALLSLLRDEALADRLRVNGCERAQAFDLSRMMACTYEIYAALASTRRD